MLQTVEGLKMAVILSQTTSSREVDSRLRIDDSDHGLSAPREFHIHCFIFKIWLAKIM